MMRVGPRKLRSVRPLATAETSYALQQKRESHAAADAEGGESEPGLSFLHLVQQRSRDANSSAADRMAQRDGAAVDVQAIGTKAQLAITRDHLRGKSFVQLDEIDLGKRELLSLEQRAHCRNWTNPHNLRRDSDDLVVDDAGLRRRAESFDSFFTQHDDCRCTVSDAG